MGNSWGKAAWYNAKNKSYYGDLDFYKGVLDRNIHVLEFGSGTGRLSLYLIKNGFKCYGVEKEEEYKDFLNEKLREIGYKNLFHTNFASFKNQKVQVILPFNFLLYMNKEDLGYFFHLLKSINYVKIILDIDNINHKLTNENFQTKNFELDGIKYSESIKLVNNNCIVNEYVYDRGDRLRINKFMIFPHNSNDIENLLNEYFNDVNLFGSFQCDPFNDFSEKLIAVINA